MPIRILQSEARKWFRPDLWLELLFDLAWQNEQSNQFWPGPHNGWGLNDAPAGD